MDRDGDGCLFSCMKCFHEMGNRGDGDTWHLQDDVLICRDFKKRCEELESFNGLVSGFGCPEFGPTMSVSGECPMIFTWFSFQCTRIPNKIARECADWFFSDAIYRDKYKDMVESKKCDDSFFYDFMAEEHVEDVQGFNCKPCLVEHVDRIMGGSVINKFREYWARAVYWEDEDLVTELKLKIKAR